MRKRTSARLPLEEPALPTEATEPRGSVEQETPTTQAPKRRRRANVEALPTGETVVETVDEQVGPTPEPVKVVTNTPYGKMNKPEPTIPAPSVLDLQMGGGFDAIIESVFEMDAPSDYKRIMKSLVSDMKPSRAEYGMLVDALDDAEENSRKALQIVANAKVARKAFEAECDVLESTMREHTVIELEKTASKKLTLADIQAAMVSRYHDEWRDLAERKAKALALVEYLEGMAKVVQERARDLRQMVAGAARH